MSNPQGSRALPRHSTVLRGKRTRMGRLLGMLASVAAPAAVVMIVTSSTMLADVVAYDAQPYSLEVKLSLYSSSEDTKFHATLKSANGTLLYVLPVDRNKPSLGFDGLMPGEEYFLEVYGDDERLLSLSYILPEEEIPPEETTEEETTTEEPGGETEPSVNPPTTRPVETGQQTEPEQTDPAQTDPEQTEPEETEPEQTDPEQTEPEQTEPEQTEPEQTEPEQTEPEQTEPEETEPEQTEPEETQPAPEPSVSCVSDSVTYNSATVILAYENVEQSALSATFNGRATTLTFGNDGTAVISASGLDPDTSYPWTVSGADGTEFASGNVRTAARTRPTITDAVFTPSLTGAEIAFSISNPDSNAISATLDGAACNFDNSGTTLSFSFTGLAEGSSHTLEIFDWDGESLVSYPFTTRSRTSAQMSVQSFTTELTTASGSFSLTNPDGNAITAKLDGNTIQPTISGGTVSVSFTGLPEESSHTLVFYDQDGGTILSYPFTTRSRTHATMSELSFTTDLTTASGSFSLNNPDGNTISAKLDGTSIQPTISGSTLSVSFTGLGEGSSHTLVFYDYDGSTILSYPFTTRSRTHATMSVQRFTSDLTTASGSFTLTNPDGNTISAKLNGNTIQPTISGNIVSVSLTGLAEGSPHTLVFYDYDGSTILSYPFTTRSRTPATASFTALSAGFNSIDVGVSITNPDGNTLELRRGSTKITADMTGSTATATIGGLSPRTAYTISVYDVSVGAQVISQQVTTDTTATWSQNTAGDVTFVYTDSFANAYPRSSLTLTDEFGESVYVSMTNDGWTASAEDIIYGGTYTVALTYNGTQLDSFTITLTGEQRPSFTMSYSGYGPATTAEALEQQTSSTTYPRYTYMLNSGYIPESNDAAGSPAGTTSSGTERFNALFLINSSGTPVRVAVAGWSDCILTNVGELMEIYFNESQLDPEITSGTYTAAFWTVDGYTAEQIDSLLWGQTGSTSNAEALSELFWNNGRRISSYVTVNITITDELGYGYTYISSDPVASNNGYYYSFECSYSPADNSTEEGFFTIVSASDPTVQLITPMSLGTTGTYGQSVSRQFVQSTSPVFAIIYSGSFDPLNFLYVMYVDPANP